MILMIFSRNTDWATDICTEKTVQDMQKFSIETEQVRHRVAYLHALFASRKRCKWQHLRFGDGASPILLRKITPMSHLKL